MIDWGALGMAKGRDGRASGTAPGNPTCPAISSIWELGVVDTSVEAQLYKWASGPLAWPAPGALAAAAAEGGASGLGDPKGPGRPQLCTAKREDSEGLWRLDPKLFLSILSSVSPTFFLDRRSEKRTHSPQFLNACLQSWDWLGLGALRTEIGRASCRERV